MDPVQMLLTLIALAIQANVPVILWGDPGEAKSALIAAMLNKLGWPFRIILGSIMDPTDVGGWPIDGPNGVERKAPSWANDLAEAKIGNQPGCLFLEELNLAPKAVQAAMMRVVHEGVIGDVRLGPNVARIAAANPIETSAGGWLFDPPLANRFFHLNWALSAQFWCDAMIAGFPAPTVPLIPANWRNELPVARALVASFIQSARQFYKDIPKDEAKASGPFPTARSWTNAATLMAAARSIGAGDAVITRLLEGCVGQGAGIAFMEWTAKQDLPDPEQLLRDPKSYKDKWPTRGDKMYCILTSVIAVVLNDNTPKRWNAAWEVIDAACTKAGNKDVGAACAKQLVSNKPEGVTKLPNNAEIFYDTLMAASRMVQPKAKK
jgi:hypothetical protein